MKAFFEELSLLDALITESILGLYKSKICVRILKDELEIEKNTFQTEEIQSYKKNLLNIVKTDFKASSLVEDDDKVYYTPVVKKKKKDKKSTIEETLDFWKTHQSVKKVAMERKLTESTIFGHLHKLVDQGSLTAEEVLGEELNRAIVQVLIENMEKSNTELFEMTGGKFSYDQLRIARAGLSDIG